VRSLLVSLVLVLLCCGGCARRPEAPLVLVSDSFFFNGQATTGLDLRYSVEGLINIPADLSLNMIETVEEFEYLTDLNNEISFPLKVTGRLPESDFSVDPGYIGRKLLENQGKKQLKKLLGDYLGTGENAQPANQPAEGQGPQGQVPEDKPIEDQIIEGILDKIFK